MRRFQREERGRECVSLVGSVTHLCEFVGGEIFLGFAKDISSGWLRAATRTATFDFSFQLATTAYVHQRSDLLSPDVRGRRRNFDIFLIIKKKYLGGKGRKKEKEWEWRATRERESTGCPGPTQDGPSRVQSSWPLLDRTAGSTDARYDGLEEGLTPTTAARLLLVSRPCNWTGPS